MANTPATHMTSRRARKRHDSKVGRAYQKPWLGA